jgi:hypothetical protein
MFQHRWSQTAIQREELRLLPNRTQLNVDLESTYSRLLAVRLAFIFMGSRRFIYLLSVFFETDDLHTYFRGLADANELPDLSTLLGFVMTLVDRYATQAAIQTSPTDSESLEPPAEIKYQSAVLGNSRKMGGAPFPPQKMSNFRISSTL